MFFEVFVPSINRITIRYDIVFALDYLCALDKRGRGSIWSGRGYNAPVTDEVIKAAIPGRQWPALICQEPKVCACTARQSPARKQ